MTGFFFSAIIGARKNRAIGPERKGNAADTYEQLHECISSEWSSGNLYARS